MKALIVSLLVVANALSMYAQDPPPCPPTTGDCTPWSANTTAYPQYASGCQAEVVYKMRDCNGQLEVYVVSVTLLGPCANQNGQQIEEHVYNGYAEMMVRELMRTLLFGPSLTNIPDCDGTDPLVTRFFTASCGLWVKCTYEVVPPNVSEDCDRGAIPTFYTDPVSGKSYVDYWKWLSCGTTCCKREYKVCMKNEFIIDSWVSNVVVDPVGAPVQMGNCSDQYLYSKQCSTGCGTWH